MPTAYIICYFSTGSCIIGGRAAAVLGASEGTSESAFAAPVVEGGAEPLAAPDVDLIAAVESAPGARGAATAPRSGPGGYAA